MSQILDSLDLSMNSSTGPDLDKSEDENIATVQHSSEQLSSAYTGFNSSHQRTYSKTPHQDRTKEFRAFHEARGDLSETVVEVLEFMKARQIDLPLLLWSVSWNVPSLVSNAVVKYARTALMHSAELPGLIRTWYRPPRTHERGQRTEAAHEPLDKWALEVVMDKVDREMHNLMPLMQSPRAQVSEATLLAISWDECISDVKEQAPTTWSILLSAAYTPKQAMRNTQKDPESSILMMIAMASFSRSHNQCKIQKLLTIYFKSCGLASKALDTLHALGVTMSQKWAYDGIDSLAEQARESLIRDLAIYEFHGSYDNMNVPFKVYEQRLSNQSHFDSGTAATIFIVKDQSIPLPTSQSVREKFAAGAKTPLSFKDIIKLELQASPRIKRQAVYYILRVLFESVAFDFDTYGDKDHALMAPPPPVNQLPTGPEHATCQHMLNTLHIEESSYEGNERVLQALFRQLRMDSPKAQERIGRERLIPWVGDQLTISRLRGLQKFHCEDLNAFERMEWLIKVIGFMHCEIALEHSYHDQYYLPAGSGIGLRRDFDILKRKGLSSPSVKGTFHQDMRDGLLDVSSARFRDLWCVVGKVEDLAMLRQKTAPELYAIATQIHEEYASTGSLDKLRALPITKQDDIFIQAVQFNRDILDFVDFDNAMKVGDVGRMEDLLPRLLFRFVGGKHKNYTGELLDLLQAFLYEWPPELKQYILRHCFLANTTGRPGHFLPIDLLQEHNIRDIKVSFAAIGPFATWRYIGKISPAIPTQRKVKDHVEAEINHFRRGKAHSSPDIEEDLHRLQTSYSISKIHTNTPGRRLNEKAQAVDIIANGLEGQKLQKAIENWKNGRISERGNREVWPDQSTSTDNSA